MSSKKKSNKNNKSKSNNNNLSKKRLLRTEYEQYRVFGEIDYSQNWLEIFTPSVVSDLFTIMHSCSDNQLKAEYIRKELSYYGFEEVGLGTNIYTMANPAYPGVIYKFALDDNGLADNFNDTLLHDMVNDYLVDECGDKPRYTRILARHPSAIVSVQERKVVVKNQDRMDTFRGSILRVLEKLSRLFMIIDLSPTHYHLNYGVDRDGDWCFVDASDLYPLDNIKDKVRCNKAVGWNDVKKKVKRCGGRLRYNDDFSAIVCDKCGMEYLPLEIRPKEKEEKGKMEKSIFDGTTMEEREQMRREELYRIKNFNAPVDVEYTDVRDVASDSDDDDEESYHENSDNVTNIRSLPNKTQPETILVSSEVEEEDSSVDDIDFDDDDDDSDYDYMTSDDVDDDDTVVIVDTTASRKLNQSNDDVEDKHDVNAFDWFLQFIGEKLTICNTDGDCRIVTTNGTTVISSNPDERGFSCDHNKLAEHCGHNIECVFHSDDTGITNVAIECVDCNVTIMSVDAVTSEIVYDGTLFVLPTEDKCDEVDSDIDDADDDDGDEEVNKLTYSVVNVSPGNTMNQKWPTGDDNLPGIFVKIDGDVEKAFDEYGLGMYIQLGDSSEVSLAIPASSFKKILKSAVDDILEDDDDMSEYDE